MQNNMAKKMEAYIEREKARQLKQQLEREEMIKKINELVNK